MNVHIKMFGPFRALGNSAELKLPSTATVDDLPPALIAYIETLGADSSLIETLSLSRFATESAVLARGEPLVDGMQLAIIPPVAGG